MYMYIHRVYPWPMVYPLGESLGDRVPTAVRVPSTVARDLTEKDDGAEKVEESAEVRSPGVATCLERWKES